MTNFVSALYGQPKARRTSRLLTITSEHSMRKVPYPHPGEILMEEFLNPMGITQYRLAKELGVPQRRIGEIVAGKRSVTADTALRLSRFFGMSEGFWVGLQADYDAAIAKDALGKKLDKIKPWVVEHGGAGAWRRVTLRS
jgi:addiction module HigA family antidote